MSAALQQDARPAHKRRRVTLACRICRHRKTRCNGGRPKCTSCIELGLSCSYEQLDDVSGVSNSQSSWESRLTNLENTIQSLVETVTQKGVPAISTPKSTLHAEADNDTEQFVATTQDHLGSLADHEATYSLDEDDDAEFTDGMASVAGEMAQSRRFFGPSSIIAFLRAASLASVRSLSSAERQLPSSLGLSDGFLVPPRTPSVSSLSCRKRRQSQILDLYALPPLDQANQLIDLFFTNTGTMFPYIHEPYVRTQLNHIKSHGARKTSRSFLCLLNALFAMTVHVDNPTRMGQITDHPNFDSEIFFNQALALLARSPRCSVVRVQSLLMMCQYRQGTQNAEELCALHAEAVGVSRELGLHTQIKLPRVSPVEQQIRRRTWLACIMIEKVLSMTFGQPQLIAHGSTLWSATEEIDLPVDPAPDLGGEESSQPTSDFTICFFATALYVLLGEILSVMYADNTDSNPEFDLSELIRQNISLERQLILWRASLPPSLSMKPWMETTEYQREGEKFGTVSSTVLYLRYLNVSILKDRPILLWFLQRGHKPGANASTTALVDVHFTELARVILNQIEVKAREAISISWSMSNRLQALGAWWFSTYYVLNSCIVMFSCLLVHVDAAQSTNGDSLDIGKVLAIEDLLQKGVEATSKIMKTYRKPNRIQGTLDRLLKLARAIIREFRSSLRRRTEVVTQESSNPNRSGTGLASSNPSGNPHFGGSLQRIQGDAYSHSWPLPGDPTQQPSDRVDDGNLQDLLWDNWGIASGWNDFDLGFEDIVTF